METSKNKEILKAEFSEKMKGICEKMVEDITAFFKDKAVEAHLTGSMGKGTNDALSDVDIWITFADDKAEQAIADRMAAYEQFGHIVQLHEMSQNAPLNGVQTGILYKIDGEIVRVDFCLCPLSSARVAPGSKVLFENEKVEVGDMIYDTKRIPKGLSHRITFFISLCFVGIKKVVRGDNNFIDFLNSEFKKYEKEFPELAAVSGEVGFDMLKKSLSVLDSLSNPEQKTAISEIGEFLTKVEKSQV